MSAIASPLEKPQALTAAQRTAKLLAYKRGFSHNFTATTPAPSKPVHVASNRYATT